jgi:protein arginine kinase
LGGAAIACATLNLIFGALDLLTYFTNTTELFSFIRNANYALLSDTEVAGFKRIVGSFTEASSFGSATLGYFAFTGRLWLLGIRPQLTAPLAFLSLMAMLFAANLAFAYSPSLGYLTACPTNVGTGMRASAMVHLPALVLSEQINQVIQAVNKIGLAVRGLYGEGTEAMGNLFQISNQTTLGEKEDEIIARLTKVIETIIDKEHDARQVLIQKKSDTLSDQIGRAYGVLTYAHAMTSKEALNLLSVMKLGVDLGAFPEDRRLPIDELFIETQPAHLQKTSQQKLNAEERDSLRAQIIRDRLKLFPKPDMGKVAREPADEAPSEPNHNE